MKFLLGLENCYLLGGINLWWWWGGENEQIFDFPTVGKTLMLIACMAFELSDILISLSASSIVIILKEKHSLVNSETIAIMLGCFLYLTIVFKGWSMFSEKGSKFSNFEILSLITSFVIRVSSSSANLFFQKTVPYLTGNA